MARSQDIWVYVEFAGSEPGRTGLELLAGARVLAAQLGGQTVAVVCGSGVTDAARSLGRYGAQRVLVADDPNLAQFGADAQADILAQAAQECQPGAILLAAGLDGSDIAGRLAVRLGGGLLANATKLSVQDGALVMEETAFDGALLISCTTLGDAPQVITVRAKVFEPGEFNEQAGVEALSYKPGQSAQRVRNVETVRQTSGDAVPLEAAGVIVAGGRGLGGPEPFAALKELADALGGSVGASRAAVDAGWVPYAMQVGQTASR